MNSSRLLLCGLSLIAATAFVTTDADACGGCIIAQTESTQVTGHRMILSISKDHTTLWDQISYSGDPQSFAWVLPIKGVVDIGLSSDSLFQSLDDQTRVQINSPHIFCQPNFCNGASASYSSSGSSGAGGGGVIVIAQQVVGPYETVQLSSQDPNALKTWLTDHGYYLPADIVPIVDAYVAEGFDFLALKLVPSKTIDSMRPIRVTSPGATPVLPLRMVAAGTGQTTPITLWIAGEGRYEPTNFQSFTIDPGALVWNWDTSSSNYTQMKQDGFTAGLGKTWLVEHALPFTKYAVEGGLYNTVQIDPEASGYGLDPMGPTAFDECTADLAALWGNIPDASLWVTRLTGDLSRAALGTDLTLGISAAQVQVSNTFDLVNTTGTPPTCPPPPPGCDGSGSSSGGNGGNGGSGEPGFSSTSCAMTTENGSSTALGLLGLTIALAFVRNRRNRFSAKP